MDCGDGLVSREAARDPRGGRAGRRCGHAGRGRAAGVAAHGAAARPAARGAGAGRRAVARAARRTRSSSPTGSRRRRRARHDHRQARDRRRRVDSAPAIARRRWIPKGHAAEVADARAGKVGRATRFSPIEAPAGSLRRGRRAATKQSFASVCRSARSRRRRPSCARQLLAAALASLLVALGLAALVAGPLTRRLRDATARRAADRRRRLRRAVRHRTANDEIGVLSRALAHRRRRAARDRSSSRREFLANVAHEIRTPVTSIRGYAEILAKSPASTPRRAKEFLHDDPSQRAAHRSARRGSARARGLEAGKGAPLDDRSRSRSHRSSQHVIDTLRTRADEIGATIAVDVGEPRRARRCRCGRAHHPEPRRQRDSPRRQGRRRSTSPRSATASACSSSSATTRRRRSRGATARASSSDSIAAPRHAIRERRGTRPRPRDRARARRRDGRHADARGKVDVRTGAARMRAHVNTHPRRSPGRVSSRASTTSRSARPPRCATRCRSSSRRSRRARERTSISRMARPTRSRRKRTTAPRSTRSSSPTRPCSIQSSSERASDRDEPDRARRTCRYRPRLRAARLAPTDQARDRRPASRARRPLRANVLATARQLGRAAARASPSAETPQACSRSHRTAARARDRLQKRRRSAPRRSSCSMRPQMHRSRRSPWTSWRITTQMRSAASWFPRYAQAILAAHQLSAPGGNPPDAMDERMWHCPVALDGATTTVSMIDGGVRFTTRLPTHRSRRFSSALTTSSTSRQRRRARATVASTAKAADA